MEHAKRRGRRESDVLHSMGVLSITCMLRELYTYACSLLHTCAYAGTSCTDVKRRVYETLQREQNGRLELPWGL